MRTLLDTALGGSTGRRPPPSGRIDERQGDPAVTRRADRAAGRGGGPCELVWVDGPDAASFLQGLLTNDVAALAAGGACSALILDNKGHLRNADARRTATAPEAFTLVAAVGDGDPILALLDEYHFSEDVDIIGPEVFAAVTDRGRRSPRRRSPGADLVLPGEVPGPPTLSGVDAAGMLAAVGGLPEAPPEELEVLRIEAGVPRVGVDVGRGQPRPGGRPGGHRRLVRQGLLPRPGDGGPGRRTAVGSTAACGGCDLPAPDRRREPPSGSRGREVGVVTSSAVSPALRADRPGDDPGGGRGGRRRRRRRARGNGRRGRSSPLQNHCRVRSKNPRPDPSYTQMGSRFAATRAA